MWSGRSRSSGAPPSRRIITRVLFAVATLLALLVAGSGVFLLLLRPRVRPPRARWSRTPERLARGTYLMNHLLRCVDCHSLHDNDRFGLPPLPRAVLAGGPLLDRSSGMPGVVQDPTSRPIPTPALGRWTDGELMRAIREGVHRSGRALFPVMPYTDLRAMSDEDLRAVVATLRAATPVNQATRPIEVSFPVNLIMRAAPAPVTEPVHAPDANDTVAYGGYLVLLAGCGRCHTRRKQGREIAAEAFAGGVELVIPTAAGRFRVVSGEHHHRFRHRGTSVAPARPSGSARRSFAAIRDAPPRVAGGLNTVMLWREYSGLSDGDLAAIYD